MSKVTVVGAGNVGATCANVLAFNEVADEVVMLDVKEGVSEGRVDRGECRHCQVGSTEYLGIFSQCYSGCHFQSDGHDDLPGAEVFGDS